MFGVRALFGAAHGFPLLAARGVIGELEEVVDAALAQVAVGEGFREAAALHQRADVGIEAAVAHHVGGRSDGHGGHTQAVGGPVGLSRQRHGRQLTAGGGGQGMDVGRAAILAQDGRGTGLFLARAHGERVPGDAVADRAARAYRLAILRRDARAGGEGDRAAHLAVERGIVRPADGQVLLVEVVDGEVLPQLRWRQVAFGRAAGIKHVVDHVAHLLAHRVRVHAAAVLLALGGEAQPHSHRVGVLQSEEGDVGRDAHAGRNVVLIRNRGCRVAGRETPADLPLAADEDIAAVRGCSDAECRGARHGSLGIEDRSQREPALEPLDDARQVQRQGAGVDAQRTAVGERHGVADIVVGHEVLQVVAHAVGGHVGRLVLVRPEDVAGAAHGSAESGFLSGLRALGHGRVARPRPQRGMVEPGADQLLQLRRQPAVRPDHRFAGGPANAFSNVDHGIPVQRIALRTPVRAGGRPVLEDGGAQGHGRNLAVPADTELRCAAAGLHMRLERVDRGAQVLVQFEQVRRDVPGAGAQRTVPAHGQQRRFLVREGALYVVRHQSRRGGSRLAGVVAHPVELVARFRPGHIFAEFGQALLCLAQQAVPVVGAEALPPREHGALVGAAQRVIDAGRAQSLDLGPQYLASEGVVARARHLFGVRDDVGEPDLGAFGFRGDLFRGLQHAFQRLVPGRLESGHQRQQRLHAHVADAGQLLRGMHGIEHGILRGRLGCGMERVRPSAAGPADTGPVERHPSDAGGVRASIARPRRCGFALGVQGGQECSGLQRAQRCGRADCIASARIGERFGHQHMLGEGLRRSGFGNPGQPVEQGPMERVHGRRMRGLADQSRQMDLQAGLRTHGLGDRYRLRRDLGPAQTEMPAHRFRNGRGRIEGRLGRRVDLALARRRLGGLEVRYARQVLWPRAGGDGPRLQHLGPGPGRRHLDRLADGGFRVQAQNRGLAADEVPLRRVLRLADQLLHLAGQLRQARLAGGLARTACRTG